MGTKKPATKISHDLFQGPVGPLLSVPHKTYMRITPRPSKTQSRETRDGTSFYPETKNMVHFAPSFLLPPLQNRYTRSSLYSSESIPALGVCVAQRVKAVGGGGLISPSFYFALKTTSRWSEVSYGFRSPCCFLGEAHCSRDGGLGKNKRRRIRRASLQPR